MIASSVNNKEIYFSDVFGHRSNVSLVFDFMDTDLEIIIKDTNIVLTPSNIKSYTLMTLQGLEYMHNNWFLHRVRIKPLYKMLKNKKFKIYFVLSGFET